jgi:hypothetical protein
LEHPDVVKSPIAKDAILIHNPETGKKYKRVPKQLRMISICEIHNDMLKPVEEGGFKYAHVEGTTKVLISDTTLQLLMPEEMRPMSDTHKQMCGCEICIVG